MLVREPAASLQRSAPFSYLGPHASVARTSRYPYTGGLTQSSAEEFIGAR